MWSVCSRRRLASIEVTIFLRWLPALFEQVAGVGSRRPIGVAVGGVAHAAASVSEQVQHPRADIWGCPPAPVFAEGHGAQRHLRDPHAGLTQKPVTHEIPSLLWMG